MRFFLLCLVFFFKLSAEDFSTQNNSFSIVFVHMGPSLPEYIKVSTDQARLFNKNCPIYLIANESAFKNSSLNLDDIIFISCESLKKSENHLNFMKDAKLGKGFWNNTTERFFYIDDFIKEYGIKHLFHMENDVMLYMDLEKTLKIFKKNYQNKIAATFDNDNRAIAGFLYIDNEEPLDKLCEFISNNVTKGGNDMIFLSNFKKECSRKYIDHLPIITPLYVEENELKNLIGNKAFQKDLYYLNFDQFNSIFDAAAIGQYLGGIDPIHGKSSPGFINESCLFNPKKCLFYWEEDEEGRLVPFISYKDESFHINNLHIHSKRLKDFYSLKESMSLNQ
jgi:hypothetical protein